MPDNHYIKQYGEKRTATCYLNVLLSKNFKGLWVMPNMLGWKHGPPQSLDVWKRHLLNPANVQRPDAPPKLKPGVALTPARIKRLAALAGRLNDVQYVVSIKNPYAWIVSMGAYDPNLGKQCGTMEGFKDVCRNLLSLYNSRYAAWMEFRKQHPRRVIVVRYCDLIRDFGGVLFRLGMKFKLERAGDKFVDVSNYVGPAEKTRPKMFDSRKRNRAFYLQRRYLVELGKKRIAVITGMVNWETLGWYGYDPEKL